MNAYKIYQDIRSYISRTNRLWTALLVAYFIIHLLGDIPYVNLIFLQYRFELIGLIAVLLFRPDVRSSVLISMGLIAGSGIPLLLGRISVAEQMAEVSFIVLLYVALRWCFSETGNP